MIETGLLREFAQGLSRADAILQDWKNSTAPDYRATYHSLYNMIEDFDKHIAPRYDYMSGSKYFFIVAAQLSEGILPESELEVFSPETRQKLIAFVKLTKES